MRAIIALVMSSMTMVSGAWAAQSPAALVLDYSGPPRNGLDAYVELAAGSQIALGPRDRVVILHYQSCREVTVTGGRIAVGDQDLTISDALDSRDGRAHCPQEVVALGTSAEPQAIAPRLDCVMVGRHKTEVGTVDILAGEAMVLSAPAQGFRLISAPMAPELKPGISYTMVVKGIRGAELARMPVVANGAARDKACLLRLE